MLKYPKFLKPILLSKYLFLVSRLLILLAFYALFRGLFYWYNAEMFSDFSFSELLSVFYGGFRFDLIGILYLNFIYFLAVLLPFQFVYKAKFQSVLNYIFIGLNIIGFAANTFDTVFFPYTLKRTTGSIFKEFGNEEGLFSIFINGIFDFWQVTVLFFLFSVLFVFTIRLIKIQKSNLKPLYFYALHTALLPLLIFMMISGIRGGFGRYTRPLAINNAGQYVKSTKDMAIVLNTPFSVLRTFRQKSFKLRKDFEEKQLDSLYTPVHHTSSKEQTLRKKNVVIIIMESFSRQHSGRLNPKVKNGNYKGFTPFLDSLMEHSLTLTNAYANGRKSIDAIPSVIAGIPTFKSHYVISNYSTNKLRGLGHILKDEGYDLAFFHGAPNGSMGFNSFMNLVGYDKYFGKDEFNDDRFYDGTWGIWDEEFLEYMAKESSKLKEPFSSVFFSVSSHHPFDVPERYEGDFKEGPHKILKCIGYSDYALRQFFKTASKMSWYNNTLFVITGDHGHIGYLEEYKNDIGDFAVPIIFYTPDGSLKGFDDRVAQHTDIFPTVIDHLNIDTPYFSFGSSLLNKENERLAFYYYRRSQILIKDSLAIKYSNNKFTELYNYILDPLLQTNLINENISQKSEMKNLYKAVLQQYTNRMIRNELTASGQ
jgi:phosphoglycerol transferase MdoB-like AlkP superfamily enzyme